MSFLSNSSGFKSPKSSTIRKDIKNKKPYDRNTPGNSLISVNTFYGKNVYKLNSTDSDIISGFACLISETRFAIEFKQWVGEAVEIFKTIPSKNYDPSTRSWSFDMSDYNSLFEKLKKIESKVVVKKLPNFVFRCLNLQYDKNITIDFSKIEGKLFNILKPFQKESLRFAVERNGRLLIADEMGLGKTFQSLAIASYYKSEWPLLVVTTKSMKNQWYDYILNYIEVPSLYVQVINTGKDELDSARIVIITHELMHKCNKKLCDKYFGVLIIDESHIVKNHKTQVTKAALELSKLAKRVILLSGTPALSRPSELYSQLAMIDEHFFPNFTQFALRYCNAKQTNFGWDTSGSSNLAELETILHKRFMIRRTKDVVFLQLPNITRNVIKLDQNFRSDDIESLNMLAESYNKKSSFNKHSALLEYFSYTAKLKSVPVCSYLSTVLEENVKFLVFAHHQVMLKAVESLLTLLHKRYVKIDGQTSSENRKRYVDYFQNDNYCMCAVLSTTAANTGITLTAAKLVIFAELHWNPTVLSQAESRAHRIGQDKQVEVRYLITNGTSDDVMWPMIQSKRQILNEVGLFDGSFENCDSVHENANNHESQIKSKKENEIDDLFGDFDDDFLKDFDNKPFVDENEKVVDDNKTIKIDDNSDELFNDDFNEIIESLDI